MCCGLGFLHYNLSSLTLTIVAFSLRKAVIHPREMAFTGLWWGRSWQSSIRIKTGRSSTAEVKSKGDFLSYLLLFFFSSLFLCQTVSVKTNLCDLVGGQRRRGEEKQRQGSVKRWSWGRLRLWGTKTQWRAERLGAACLPAYPPACLLRTALQLPWARAGACTRVCGLDVCVWVSVCMGHCAPGFLEDSRTLSCSPFWFSISAHVLRSPPRPSETWSEENWEKGIVCVCVCRVRVPGCLML